MDVKIDCVCPPVDGGARHPNGDTVTLRDRLDFRGAVVVRQTLGSLYVEDPDTTAAEITGVLIEQYLLVGVTGWTIRDEKGKPVPFSRVNLRAFMNEHPLDALTVGDAADNLYSEQVVLPLLRRASNSSPPTQTETETSPTTGGRSPRKPRKPSSITSIPTDGIVTTSPSPGGDGSTSRNSVSAA